MDNTTVMIYMKSGNVLSLPLTDMRWKQNGDVKSIKWYGGDKPSLKYINPSEIEAIVQVADMPEAGQWIDSVE